MKRASCRGTACCRPLLLWCLLRTAVPQKMTSDMNICLQASLSVFSFSIARFCKSPVIVAHANSRQNSISPDSYEHFALLPASYAAGEAAGCDGGGQDCHREAARFFQATQASHLCSEHSSKLLSITWAAPAQQAPAAVPLGLWCAASSILQVSSLCAAACNQLFDVLACCPHALFCAKDGV